MTYYDILGVPIYASDEEIRSAYKVQIKFFHPDVFQGNPEVARIKTQQLNEAYSVLADPYQKARYDLYLRGERQTQPQEEPFYSQPAGNSPYSNSDAAEPRPLKKWPFVLCAAVILYLVYTVALEESDTASSNQGVPPRDTEEESVHLEAVTPPRNGKILQQSGDSRIAPLTIETRGDGYYLVRLKDASSGRNVISVFIVGGRTVDVDVPLGNFELYYAYGDTWYGEESLFGPDTVYSKADELFDFYESDGYVNGWTVELYLQQNGNLDIETVSAEDFQ